MSDEDPLTPGSEETGAGVSVPPPLVYLGGIVLGWMLDRWLLPLSLGSTDPRLRWGSGLVVLLASSIFLFAAVARFRATGQDPKPWRPTPVLIEASVYRLSRNPMYLALALLQVGLGLLIDNLWIVVLTLPVLAVVDRLAVRPEETYLEERFGSTYREYRRRVRRWL